MVSSHRLRSSSRLEEACILLRQFGLRSAEGKGRPSEGGHVLVVHHEEDDQAVVRDVVLSVDADAMSRPGGRRPAPRRTA